MNEPLSLCSPGMAVLITTELGPGSALGCCNEIQGIPDTSASSFPSAFIWMTEVICAEKRKILKAMPGSLQHGATSQMLAENRSLQSFQQGMDRTEHTGGEGFLTEVLVCCTCEWSNEKPLAQGLSTFPLCLLTQGAGVLLCITARCLCAWKNSFSLSFTSPCRGRTRFVFLKYSLWNLV